MTEAQAAELIEIGHKIAIGVGVIAFWTFIRAIFGVWK
jgi:hypothetical protein